MEEPPGKPSVQSIYLRGHLVGPSGIDPVTGHPQWTAAQHQQYRDELGTPVEINTVTGWGGSRSHPAGETLSFQTRYAPRSATPSVNSSARRRSRIKPSELRSCRRMNGQPTTSWATRRFCNKAGRSPLELKSAWTQQGTHCGGPESVISSRRALTSRSRRFGSTGIQRPGAHCPRHAERGQHRQYLRRVPQRLPPLRHAAVADQREHVCHVWP